MEKKNILLLLLFIFGVGAALFVWQKQVPQSTESIAKLNLIRVEYPLTGQRVKSPLIITGEARGSWFFEASFPVELRDANGNILVAHYAEAQDEWMTENFVPFRATLEFQKPATPTGTLVLKKDNPSDLPEHDDQITIPVRFE